MEWVGLLTWLLIVALALPLAALGSLTSASLAVQSLVSVGGLVCCVLYLGDLGEWWAWASAGLALAAAAALGVGAAHLMAEEPRSLSAGQAAEEHAAALAGATLPLLFAAAFVMVLAAVGVTTIE